VHGCAAFLGAFERTAEQKTYCRCTLPRDDAGAPSMMLPMQALPALELGV
jgi:hypothetical protein